MPGEPARRSLGSLCTGAGALDLAVGSLLDVDHAWLAETDPAASKVLAAHWPDVPNLGDITAVTWTDVASVDVLCGGWPCQPFSAAGRHGGSADDRHLWPVGVLPALTALRPWLFIGENVPGLLTNDSGRVFARVLADLDALGYTTSWTTVGACLVGACHHRHRLFLAATLAELPTPPTVPLAHRVGTSWEPTQSVLFGDAAAVKWPRSGMARGGSVWPLPVRTCGADGAAVLPTPTAMPYGNNQSPSAGAAVRPSLEAIVQMLPTPTAHCEPAARGVPNPDSARRRMESGRRNLEDAVALLPTPTARDAIRGSGRPAPEGRPLSEVIALLPTPPASDAAKGGPNQRGSSGDLMLPAAVQASRFGAYEAAVRRQEVAFGLPAPEPTELNRNDKPRLTAAFPEWLMGFPAGWITDHVGRNESIRIAGNAVVRQAAAYALASLPTFRAAAGAALAGLELAGAP